MPVHRLGAGHDLTCERAVQDAGKYRKMQFEYQTPCTKSKVS
jgi:hypothetical protein